MKETNNNNYYYLNGSNILYSIFYENSHNKILICLEYNDQYNNLKIEQVLDLFCIKGVTFLDLSEQFLPENSRFFDNFLLTLVYDKSIFKECL